VGGSAQSSGGQNGGGLGSGGLGSGGQGGGVKRTLVYVGAGGWDNEPGQVLLYEYVRATGTLEFVTAWEGGGLISFMAFDVARGHVFAADEKSGGVVSFSLDKETGELTSLGATAHSSHPVNLTISPDGAYLLGANYNEGSVDVYPIDGSGKAGVPTNTLATGSHAHSVYFMPGVSEPSVLVGNEGADTISNLTWAAGTLALGTPATSASFSPRHMTFDSTGRVYVVSERGDFVTAYDRAASGALTQAWQAPRLDSGTPTSETGADIHLSPDEKYLFASNRGSSNTLVSYRLTAGDPELVGHQKTGGGTPRTFAVDPQGQVVVVAHHGSPKGLSVLPIESDGSLGAAKVLSTDFSPYFVYFVEL
jgi:6-phosphogluconolactonase